MIGDLLKEGLADLVQVGSVQHGSDGKPVNFMIGATPKVEKNLQKFLLEQGALNATSLM